MIYNMQWFLNLLLCLSQRFSISEILKFLFLFPCETKFHISKIQNYLRDPSKLFQSFQNYYYYFFNFYHKTTPAGNYMFKVNNRNIRIRCGICSKLTIKIPERRQWRRSGIFIVNFEHISHLFLVFLLLFLKR